MSIKDRLSKTLKIARLTPRNLGGAIDVHHVTIYRTMRDDSSLTPTYENVLRLALNKIDSLLLENKLPFQERLTNKEKIERLKQLLN